MATRESEGPGARGMATHLLAVLLERRGTDDRRGRVGHVAEEGAEGLGQLEGDPVLAGWNHLSDVVEEAPPPQAVRLVTHSVEAGDHCLGVEGRTVVELHSRPELEGELGRIRIGGPLGGQTGDVVQLVIEADERLVHRLLYREGE